MLPLQPSRPRGASNLLIGAQLDSRLVLTTNLLRLFLAGIWPKCLVPSACSLIPPPSLRLGLDLTTSLISCTPRGPSFIGMSVRAWRRENFPKPVKIWQPWKRITKKLVWTLSKAKKMPERSIKNLQQPKGRIDAFSFYVQLPLLSFYTHLFFTTLDLIKS